MPESGWQEKGWFRLHIAIDSTLFNKTLGLSVWQAGTSSIYLDGKLISTLGEQSGDWIGVAKELRFNQKSDHVLAVRYTNTATNNFHSAGFNAGLYLRLGRLNPMAEDRIHFERPLIAYQWGFTALSIAIGLLHLFLFVFFPNQRQNLFFAIFLFFYAAVIFVDYQHSLTVNFEQHLLFVRMHRAFYILFVLSQLRFLYSLYHRQLPRQFLFISIATLCMGVLVVLKPVEHFGIYKIVDMIILFEIWRVIIQALIKKKEGSWIIGLAFLLYFVFGSFDALMDAGVIAPLSQMLNPYAIGSIGFFIAMSIYLARDFARTNKTLAEQRTEQILLEAENARQSKELEEARQLQLSMLPKELPHIPNIEIGVFMRTATEVGGDYYDFKVFKNGSLTAVIGDATGHGMKAGTMVASMKSLFGTLKQNEDYPHFFTRCSRIFKGMQLGNLFMSLAMVKIEEYRMVTCSAGMPPILIFREQTESIEEIVNKAMPLGASLDFPYRQIVTELHPGDTILLMSDGFPELFNDNMEILDYPGVKTIFAEIAEKSPEEVIVLLDEAAEKWRRGAAQNDDITFVALKIK